MAGNGLFGLVSLFVTAGGCVMLFFIILAGTTDSDPLNRVYFLWADTSNISGAPNTSEWTLWNVCESGNNGSGGMTTNCGSVHAANPFLPQQNFGTSNNIPQEFLNDHKTYYYLSRFTFAFYLISLFFMLGSMVTGMLALCSRLGSAISALAAAWALFCITVTAALMTSCYVIGRNAFNDAGIDAGLGLYAFGFTWGAVGCMIVATACYCIGFSLARRHHHRERALTTEKRGGSRFPFFRRRSPAGDSERTFS